jgi:hypothetical protein
MKKSEVTLPSLPNEKNNPTRSLSSEKRNSPLSGGAFRPKDGDVFVFDIYDDDDTVYAVEQDITNSEYVTVNIACHRNGKASWIGLGQLTLVDKDVKPTCALTEELRALATVDDLLEKIKGRTIKVQEMVDKQFVPFGQTNAIVRPTPVLIWG